MAAMIQPLVANDLYTAENFQALAKLLLSLWKPAEAVGRAAMLSCGNDQGVKLAREIDRQARSKTGGRSDRR